MNTLSQHPLLEGQKKLDLLRHIHVHICMHLVQGGAFFIFFMIQLLIVALKFYRDLDVNV